MYATNAKVTEPTWFVAAEIPNTFCVVSHRDSTPYWLRVFGTMYWLRVALYRLTTIALRFGKQRGSQHTCLWPWARDGRWIFGGTWLIDMHDASRLMTSCISYHASCIMHQLSCIDYHASTSMHRLAYFKHRAACSMKYASWLMHHALCFMHHVLSIMYPGATLFNSSWR